ICVPRLLMPRMTTVSNWMRPRVLSAASWSDRLPMRSSDAGRGLEKPLRFARTQNPMFPSLPEDHPDPQTLATATGGQGLVHMDQVTETPLGKHPGATLDRPPATIQSMKFVWATILTREGEATPVGRDKLRGTVRRMRAVSSNSAKPGGVGARRRNLKTPVPIHPSTHGSAAATPPASSKREPNEQPVNSAKPMNALGGTSKGLKSSIRSGQSNVSAVATPPASLKPGPNRRPVNSAKPMNAQGGITAVSPILKTSILINRGAFAAAAWSNDRAMTPAVLAEYEHEQY
ncbi:hypothetical protein, partial [Mesorhizobium sp.]|uniref:hypothetical protein n=1 Tax=Mesorhizobium sp. TaxID=1871066 RepID=UPI0025BEE96A